MEENIKGVAEQLLDLAQTPEQVQFITNSDATIMQCRVEELQAIVKNNDQEKWTLRRIADAKEETLMNVIKMFAEMRVTNNYYD